MSDRVDRRERDDLLGNAAISKNVLFNIDRGLGGRELDIEHLKEGEPIAYPEESMDQSGVSGQPRGVLVS